MSYTTELENAVQCLQNGDFDNAFLLLNTLIHNYPSSFESLFYRGLFFYRIARYDDALNDFFASLSLHKNFATYLNIGLCYFQKQALKTAIEYFQKVIECNPSYYEVYINIGDTYVLLEDYKKAKQYYQKSLELHSSAFAISNLALCEKNLGNYERALLLYEKSLSLEPTNPDMHFNYAIVLLSLGKLTKGFQEFEHRIHAKNRQIDSIYEKLPYQEYNKQHLLNKNILVYQEQGFGDAIQFIRFTKKLAGLARKVFLLIPNELVILFSTLSYLEIVTIETMHQHQIDFKIRILSLPAQLMIKKKMIINDPYIFLKTKKIFTTLIFPPNKLKIGVAWQGEKNHLNDKNRSIPFSTFNQIIKNNSCINFYSLQLGENICETHNLVDCSAHISDFYDTAQIIQNLDLVITIDSAVAHLSGALGKPTWILLPYIPDWRWGLKSKKTLWYKSVRLYRQHAPNDWNNVITKTISDLKKLRSQYDLSIQTDQKKQIL